MHPDNFTVTHATETIENGANSLMNKLLIDIIK